VGATIDGNLSNSGLVDFGSAYGVLTITGNYTQTSAGTLRVNISATGQHDSLSISGQATLGGALSIYGDWAGSYDILDAIPYAAMSETSSNS